MPLKLVIFDLDGTLVDTAADLCGALNAATKPYGLPPMNVEETKGVVGEGIHNLIKRVLGEDYADKHAEALKAFTGYYSTHLTEHSRPYPGVKRTLELLGGIKLAVLSNKSEDFCVRILEDLGLRGHFDLIAGGDKLPELKPSGKAVQYVLGQMGMGVEDAILVGDSDYDINAATAAGIKCVAAAYGFRPRSVLSGADYIIDSMVELIPIVMEISPWMDRRKERRFWIPRDYSAHLRILARSERGQCDLHLIDFSEHGLLVESAGALAEGHMVEVTTLVPSSLEHQVKFHAKVKHCRKMGDGNANLYVAGLEVGAPDDKIWHEAFKDIISYVTDQLGDVY